MIHASLWKDVKQETDCVNRDSYGEIVETECVFLVEGMSESGGIARKAQEEATSMEQDQAISIDDLLCGPSLLNDMHA